MSSKILQSHIREGRYGASIMTSIALHLALLVLILLAARLFPPPVINLGGFSQAAVGEFMQVGLTPEPLGGTGMYKPALQPKPETAPLPKEEPRPKVEEASSPEEVFVEKNREKTGRTEPDVRSPPRTAKKPEQREASSGTIPQQSEPGKAGATSGSQTAAGGTGLTVGVGTGQSSIDSWYVRQVERRVGRNWLRTTLGQLEKQVEAIIIFEVTRGGQIVNVEFESRSGVASVDLAAERAVQASSPLPPLPRSLSGRSIRFRAIFAYPQR